MENLQQPRYGIINSGLFGATIVSGIVTGVRYTEDKPVYEIQFGKNKWETPDIFETKEGVLNHLQLTDLERVKETHGLKIKFNQ